MCLRLIFKKEWQKSLRHPLKFILMLLLPVLTLFLTLLLQTGLKPSVQIGVLVPHSSSNRMATTLTHELSALDGVSATLTSTQTPHADLVMAKYSAILSLSEDGSYEVLSMDHDLKIALGDFSLLENYLATLTQNQLSAEARCICYFFFILMITSTLFATSFHQEVSENLMVRYRLAPHHASIYMLGLFLYTLFMSLLQVLLTTLLLVMAPINFGLSSWNFLLLGILLGLICSTLALFIIHLTSNELTASTLASSIALLLSLLGGSLIPFSKMPPLFQKISGFTFIHWLIDLTTTLKQAPYSHSIGISLLLVLPFSLLLVLLFSLILLIFSLCLSQRKLQLKRRDDNW